jgi:hypothetical protein
LQADFSRLKTILTFADKAQEEKAPFDSLMKSDKLMKTPVPARTEESFEDGSNLKKI